MFQSLAVGGFFLVSLFTLIATPGAPRPSADLAPPAAVQLIADVHSSDEVIPTEPPLLPAPDPFEGMEAFDPVPGGPPPGVRPVLPTPEPPPATWVAGPPLLQGGDILATASALLGVPYVWGAAAWTAPPTSAARGGCRGRPRTRCTRTPRSSRRTNCSPATR